jgi:hypothetical protein
MTQLDWQRYYYQKRVNPIMSRNIPIGFSQLIKLAWLDFTAQQKLKGHSQTEIRAALDEFLSDQVSVGSNARRSSRQKAISILSKIWVNVPQSLESFRDEGLALFKRLPDSHIALHWGMAIAVYPFFAMAAENVGRLLRLQNDVSTVQLQKRMREKMGERETVARATRQLIRCWEQWGVLTDTDKKGRYTATKTHTITDAQLTTWLLEGALIASEGQSAVLHNLVNYTPGLFPFSLSSDYFTPNERLETFSQGVSEVSVAFKYN